MPDEKICPTRLAPYLDNPLRRLIHPPKKVIGPYLAPGDTALDVGCGSGFFTRAMARMVGETGKVIAVDVQEEMLEALREKAAKEKLISRIDCRLAGDRSLNLDPGTPVDFVLAFYVMHEMPDIPGALREIAAVMKPGAYLLLAEPSMHVSDGAFRDTIVAAGEAGLEVDEEPHIRWSKTVLMQKSGDRLGGQSLPFSHQECMKE
jgi:ubiquinone/menaquinone biosynthesis C-methylase UbiE